jgi:hypothetical protein
LAALLSLAVASAAHGQHLTAARHLAHRDFASTKALPAVIATDQSNGQTLTLTVGQRLRVVLASTYWTLDQSSNPTVLDLEGQPTITPTSGCVPGAGCGTAAANYTALAPGNARVTATRTTCGEAMSCGTTPQTYTLQIDVLAAQPVTPHTTTPATVPVVHVIAGKPTEFKFALKLPNIASSASLPPGRVVFRIHNVGKLPHSFKVCTNPSSATGNTCKGSSTHTITPGKTATLSVTFRAKGTYEYLSTIEGQAATGMKGQLRID